MKSDLIISSPPFTFLYWGYWGSCEKNAITSNNIKQPLKVYPTSFASLQPTWTVRLNQPGWHSTTQVPTWRCKHFNKLGCCEGKVSVSDGMFVYQTPGISVHLTTGCTVDFTKQQLPSVFIPSYHRIHRDSLRTNCLDDSLHAERGQI